MTSYQNWATVGGNLSLIVLYLEHFEKWSRRSTSSQWSSITGIAQKMKFSIKDFFSKCEQSACFIPDDGMGIDFNPVL